MYANGRHRNTYDFSVRYVRGVAYILVRRVIFYIRNVFSCAFYRMRFDIIRGMGRPDLSGWHALHGLMFQFARNRTNKCSITNDFFLSTAGNLALGRAQSWKDARRAAGFSQIYET